MVCLYRNPFFNAERGGEGSLKFSFQAICDVGGQQHANLHCSPCTLEAFVITGYVTETQGVKCIVYNF